MVDPWAGVPAAFTADEAERYAAAGYARSPEPGTRPVLLVIDVTYEFCGRNPAGSASGRAAGPAAWEAIGRIARLVQAARGAGVPVIYSRNAPRRHPVEQGGWRHTTGGQGPAEGLDIVAEVAPQEGDLVVDKTKPSPFFGTPLASWLLDLGADTVFVTGISTSGCVRAAVTDAFSYNLRTFVVADAVADRSRTSHDVGLFEMRQKYAGLVGTDWLVSWLGSAGQ